ncbi:amino acid permease [Escherichia coli]
MFTPEVGKVIMALMVMSCCGSSLAGSSPLPRCLTSSSMKATSLNFFRVTKVDAPVQGMLTIVIIQSGLALMTISPSLNSQFNVLVNLAVVTNIIPYILSMAALVIIQKVANVLPQKRKLQTLLLLLARCIAFMRCTHPGKKPCCTSSS